MVNKDLLPRPGGSVPMPLVQHIKTAAIYFLTIDSKGTCNCQGKLEYPLTIFELTIH